MYHAGSFSVVAGLLYGAWVDGTGTGLLILYVVAFLASLAGILRWVDRRNVMVFHPQKP